MKELNVGITEEPRPIYVVSLLTPEEEKGELRSLLKVQEHMFV